MSFGTQVGLLNFISVEVYTQGGRRVAFKQNIEHLLTVNGRLQCSITNTPSEILRED